jgi:hypothetical protein
MKENSGRTLTGLNLYLALSKLDLLLAYGERATPLPDADWRSRSSTCFWLTASALRPCQTRR